MTYSLEPPEELLKHFGVKGMRWGVRRRDTKSILKGVVRQALGMPAHRDGTKAPTTKKDKRAHDILGYTLAVTTGGNSNSKNPYRRIGDKRVISKGENLVTKHASKPLKFGLDLINIG